MKQNSSDRKERVTISLSQEAVRFLHRFRKQENAPSLSALVENMIERTKQAQELADLSASATAYYNSLTEAEMQEQSSWGEVGAAGLAAFESEVEETAPELAHANR